VFFFTNAIFLYARMDVTLTGAWTVGRILLISGSQEFIHPNSVPGASEHSGSKNKGAVQAGPKTQNGDFLENVSNDID
jgi:hypothetical protein